MKNRLILLLFVPLFVNAQLQSPSEFFGFELGEKFTRHHEVVGYFSHVAANSEMVNVKEYGRTYENRKLLLSYISTKENLQNLEQIRTDN